MVGFSKLGNILKTVINVQIHVSPWLTDQMQKILCEWISMTSNCGFKEILHIKREGLRQKLKQHQIFIQTEPVKVSE